MIIIKLEKLVQAICYCNYQLIKGHSICYCSDQYFELLDLYYL